MDFISIKKSLLVHPWRSRRSRKSFPLHIDSKELDKLPCSFSFLHFTSTSPHHLLFDSSFLSCPGSSSFFTVLPSCTTTRRSIYLSICLKRSTLDTRMCVHMEHIPCTWMKSTHAIGNHYYCHGTFLFQYYTFSSSSSSFPANILQRDSNSSSCPRSSTRQVSITKALSLNHGSGNGNKLILEREILISIEWEHTHYCI